MNLNASFYFLGFFSIKQDLGALVTESNDYLIEILAKFVFANCINRQRME